MGWRLQRYPIFYANSGYEIMPIAHMDLFPNALFALFTLSAERYIPLTSPGIKVKG